MKHGKQVGEEEYAEKEYHKKNGVIFLEDEQEFFLLRVYQFSTYSGMSSQEVREGVVFRYARDREVDELHLFETVQKINWRVNEHNKESPQDKLSS